MLLLLDWSKDENSGGLIGSDHDKAAAVGLRILLIQRLSEPRSCSKPLVTKTTSSSSGYFPIHHDHHKYNSNYFLKSCSLCNKNLSPDKDVYMYRGDQGFCSVECRERQIYLDEIKDLEASTIKDLAAFRQSQYYSCGSGEHFRHRQKERVIFS